MAVRAAILGKAEFGVSRVCLFLLNVRGEGRVAAAVRGACDARFLPRATRAWCLKYTKTLLLLF